MKSTLVAKEVGIAWKTMTEAEKAPYNTDAATKKKEHALAVEKWNVDLEALLAIEAEKAVNSGAGLAPIASIDRQRSRSHAYSTDLGIAGGAAVTGTFVVWCLVDGNTL